MWGGRLWPRSDGEAVALELELLRRLVALDCELDEAVAELGIADPVRLEELAVDAGLGEAGDRVELVDEDLLAVHEEVAAGEPAAATERENPARQLPHALGCGSGDLGGDDQLHAALGVLGLVVVPIRALRDDLARRRGRRDLVAEQRALDLFARRGRLHDHARVVPARFLDRPVELLLAGG